MSRPKAKWLPLLFILAFIGILYYYLFYGGSEKIKFGKPANAIRENVKVPIIEPGMKRIKLPNNVGGGRWEGKDEKEGLVHLWKIVSPNSGVYLLDKESDSFKKYKDAGTYWQLNVYSTIIGDSISMREGKLWLRCNDCPNSELVLDEKGLDSVFIKWGINQVGKK